MMADKCFQCRVDMVSVLYYCEICYVFFCSEECLIKHLKKMSRRPYTLFGIPFGIGRK